MAVSFVYHPDLGGFDYGPGHPLRIERLDLTVSLMEAFGLMAHPDLNRVEAAPAEQAALLAFHRPDYLEVLRRADSGLAAAEAAGYGLGPGDNPVFKGLWDWASLLTGASLAASEAVAEGRVEVAFNIAGGMHHAAPARASGFCYLNDAVLAIKSLLARGLKVAYLDFDAHHGDGVQNAFYDTDRVLTISIHQDGARFFPGTGAVSETGIEAGRGYSVNLPLPAYTDDELYIWAIDQIVPELVEAFAPDVLVTQLGVDSLYNDPLTGLYCTDRAMLHAWRMIKGLDRPWVALGGGGYDLVNVARCWTQALAVMLDVELPETMPESFMSVLAGYGYRRKRLQDNERLVTGATKRRLRATIESGVAALRATIFPTHGLRP